jgi:hypothetical protein
MPLSCGYGPTIWFMVWSYGWHRNGAWSVGSCGQIPSTNHRNNLVYRVSRGAICEEFVDPGSRFNLGFLGENGTGFTEAGILVYLRYEPVLKIDPYQSRSEKGMEFCQGNWGSILKRDPVGENFPLKFQPQCPVSNPGLILDPGTTNSSRIAPLAGGY